MKKMQNIYFRQPLLLAMALLLLLVCSQVSAGDITYMGAIDEIDYVFNAGGGSYTGSFSSGADNDWLIFEATAGDVLTLTGYSDNYVNAVLLQDVVNGDFEVGDVVDVLNFNNNNIGLGTDLKILTTHLAWGGSCCNFFGSGNTSTLTYTALYTGQYGLGLAVYNNSLSNSPATTYTVTLSGNTTINAVPAPSPLVLVASSILGLGFLRRKRASSIQR